MAYWICSHPKVSLRISWFDTNDYIDLTSIGYTIPNKSILDTEILS